MTAPAKPEETATPWTDARLHDLHQTWTGASMRKCSSGYWVPSDDAEKLERHLRRIVEAWDKSENPYHDVAAAIQAAKEEISK